MKSNENILHIWSIVCSNASVDTDSNNLSLYNLIEKLTLTIPKETLEEVKNSKANGILFPVDFEVVSRFQIKKPKNEAFDFRLTILSPAGKSIASASEQKIALKEGLRNIRLRNKFKSLPVEDSGEYSIAVEIKDLADSNYTRVHLIPLDIEIRSNQDTSVKTS